MGSDGTDQGPREGRRMGQETRTTTRALARALSRVRQQRFFEPHDPFEALFYALGAALHDIEEVAYEGDPPNREGIAAFELLDAFANDLATELEEDHDAPAEVQP